MGGFAAPAGSGNRSSLVSSRILKPDLFGARKSKPKPGGAVSRRPPQWRFRKSLRIENEKSASGP